MPESPAFALKHRVHREPKVEEVRDTFLLLLVLILKASQFFPFTHLTCRSTTATLLLITLNLVGVFLCQVKQHSPVKAPPVPHFGLPFQPRLPENHHVEVCPFSFEERERERKVLKEKRLEDKRNEEVKSLILNMSLNRGIRTKTKSLSRLQLSRYLSLRHSHFQTLTL